jgi:Zn-finger nucleic acid-binding protein
MSHIIFLTDIFNPGQVQLLFYFDCSSKLIVHMKCPNCGETLVMADRQGVEIDYCPKCRGVWLDKGELDKIIERSAQYESGFKKHEGEQQRYNEGEQQRYYDDDDDYKKRQNHPQRKRKGFLGDFFDFD